MLCIPPLRGCEHLSDVICILRGPRFRACQGSIGVGVEVLEKWQHGLQHGPDFGPIWRNHDGAVLPPEQFLVEHALLGPVH